MPACGGCRGRRQATSPSCRPAAWVSPHKGGLPLGGGKAGGRAGRKRGQRCGARRLLPCCAAQLQGSAEVVLPFVLLCVRLHHPTCITPPASLLLYHPSYNTTPPLEQATPAATPMSLRCSPTSEVPPCSRVSKGLLSDQAGVFFRGAAGWGHDRAAGTGGAAQAT